MPLAYLAILRLYSKISTTINLCFIVLIHRINADLTSGSLINQDLKTDRRRDHARRVEGITGYGTVLMRRLETATSSPAISSHLYAHQTTTTTINIDQHRDNLHITTATDRISTRQTSLQIISSSDFLDRSSQSPINCSLARLMQSATLTFSSIISPSVYC